MKKVLWIFLIYIMITIIWITCFIYNNFRDYRYDLSNISQAEKNEIFKLINCENISDEIELKELQIPKTYRDIYYELYFETNYPNIEKYILNYDEYLFNIYRIKNNNYVCYIGRIDDKNIDILENIIIEGNIHSSDNNNNGELNNSISNNRIIEPNIQYKDVTQKILNGDMVSLGIIQQIDEKYIYYSNKDKNKAMFDKSIFTYINGRTCKNMILSDVQIGDYINPVNKQILVFRNISGEELKEELLFNFTLKEEERIVFVNSIAIETINIIDENKAIVTIKYGDIIGDELTDEIFTTSVEFNNQTNYYSKGNNIGSVDDLELAKGNINSIIIDLNTIHERYPRVVLFESDDT